MLSCKRFLSLTCPILAAALLLLFVVTVAAGFAVLEYSAQACDERLALLKTRHHLERIHRLVATIETSFRGYVLTRQPEFLSPMAEAEARLEPALGDLGASAAELADFREDVEALRGGVRVLLASKRALLLQLYSHRESEVMSHIQDGKGYGLSTSLRRRFEALEAALEARQSSLEEPTLLNAFRAAFRARPRKAEGGEVGCVGWSNWS